MTTRTYRLPFPPSINCYIRRGNNRSYMTKQGKQFRGEVCDMILAEETLGQMRGRLAVHVELVAPTRRKYDVDNRIKPVLDALQAAGVFADDEQVDKIVIERKHVEAPGCCDVTIVEIGEPTC